MELIHISKSDGVGSHADQSRYLEAACAELGIGYKRLIEEEVDVLDLVRNEQEKAALVYRSAVGPWGEEIERLLVGANTKTIYHKPEMVITGMGGSYYHIKAAGLPHITSIPFLPRKKRETIAFAEYLGGFPLVIKVSGGMEGVGVMRVDSTESLNSVSDYLRRDPKAEVRLMSYIEHSYYARLVVADNRVVASTRDEAPLGDFRANARGPRNEQGSSFIASPEVEAMAVKAVESMGVKVGGVDVLYGTDDEVYLSEVNYPFNFAETQRVSGVNIARHILDTILA